MRMGLESKSRVPSPISGLWCTVWLSWCGREVNFPIAGQFKAPFLLPPLLLHSKDFVGIVRSQRRAKGQQVETLELRTGSKFPWWSIATHKCKRIEATDARARLDWGTAFDVYFLSRWSQTGCRFKHGSNLRAHSPCPRPCYLHCSFKPNCKTVNNCNEYAQVVNYSFSVAIRLLGDV